MNFFAASWRCALRLAGDLEREADVLDHGAPREGGLFLEHHADRGVRAAHLLAGHRDAAVVVLEQAADHVEQGRLAAAGRADHGEEFARRDRERDAVDRDQRPLGRVEALGDVVDDEDRLGGRRPASARAGVAAVTMCSALAASMRASYGPVGWATAPRTVRVGKIASARGCPRGECQRFCPPYGHRHGPVCRVIAAATLGP